VPLSHAAPDASSRCPPDMCVAAVLGDALHRVSVLGGREGMSWSLGSVYGGSVTRFLGGSLRGVASRVIATPRVMSSLHGVAVSRDGCTLLVSDFFGGSHAIHEYDVVDGSRRRVVGSKGDGPLQCRAPCQVCIAPDDFVYVADYSNDRVQVLTPTLDFRGFVGVGQLRCPSVCVPTPTSLSCRRQPPIASACSTGVTALFFVSSGPSAAVTADCHPRMDCASCQATVASQSSSGATVA
jgi:hypothetical protein